MSANIITTEDLIEFKMELLDDIKQLLQDQIGQPANKWIKSPEVRELLGISPGTLQTLRNKGIIPFTRIGNVLFYDYKEIMQVLEKNKVFKKF